MTPDGVVDLGYIGGFVSLCHHRMWSIDLRKDAEVRCMVCGKLLGQILPDPVDGKLNLFFCETGQWLGREDVSNVQTAIRDS